MSKSFSEIRREPGTFSGFRYMYGAVYIFDNPGARRVKIGMTTNRISDRLLALNDMWVGRKVTCQICGGRRNSIRGYVPQHAWTGPHPRVGFNCPGGKALPFERDTKIAEAYLEDLVKRQEQMRAVEKGSATRIINTLKKRIELYRSYVRPTEDWRFHVGFYTQGAEKAELLSHEILASRLDKQVPLGEVFDCSVIEAEAAVTEALSQLGFLATARRETSINVYHPDPRYKLRQPAEKFGSLQSKPSGRPNTA